jgi:hypothetical protein
VAALTVTTAAQQVPDGWAVVQNLGPVDVWFSSTAANASATQGTKLAVGGTLDVFVGDQTPTLWVATASATADLRFYTNTAR